jgi:hypothetical protein
MRGCEEKGSWRGAAVARERLVKIQQDGKYLAGAVAICELYRLAVALLLLVVPS